MNPIDKTFSAFETNWVPTAQPRAQAVIAPKKRGGLLASLISELGGAGGAAGGAAAGAAAGSIVPGVGTVIGGLAGALLGGFAGGTGGRLLEDKVRTGETNWGDALKEGAVSGALSGVGQGAGLAVKAVRGARAAKAAGQILPQLGTAGQVAGGAVDDVAKVAKLTAGKNLPTRVGQNLYRNTLGVDDIVMPGNMKPGTLFKADELVKEARQVGLRGTPKAMQRQVASQYGLLGEELGGVLSKSTATTSAPSLIAQAQKEIASKLPIRIDGVPVRQELARSLNQLGRGKVTAAQLNQFKNGLDVGSAFKKLQTGSSLTAKETADLALWKQADNWITKLAPEAKALTTRQSNLYGLAQGLGKMTRTPGEAQGIGDLAIRTASPLVRKAENFAGRAALRAGGVAPGTVGAPASFVGSTLKNAKYQSPGSLVRAISGSVEPTDEQQIQGYGDMGTEADLLPGMGGDQVQQPQASLQDALIQAQQLLGGNQTPATYLSYAKALLDEQQGAAGGGANITKVTAQQYGLAQAGAQSLQQLAGLLQSDPSVLTRSATPGRKLPIVGGVISNAAGTGEFDAIGYNIADALLRLRTGAAANASEVKNLQQQLMPRAGDSQQTVSRKLQQLQQAFDGVLQTAGGGGSDPGYAETDQYATGGF